MLKGYYRLAQIAEDLCLYDNSILNFLHIKVVLVEKQILIETLSIKLLRFVLYSDPRQLV